MTGRRRFLAAALASPWLAGARTAFPWRPLRIVVPNAAGGAADLTARLVAAQLAGPLGQQVVVDNRPGAGGVVAGELVARAEPDGHTLLLVSSGTAVSAALFRTLPFDPLRDFAPVSMLATFDLALVAREGGPVATLADLLAQARARPGRINLGTPQVGTTQHLAAELFKTAAGLDLQVVPFNGTPALIAAARSGEVDAGLDILGPLAPQLHSGALRPLAVLGEGRSPAWPQVPAAREAGGVLAGFHVSSWNGLAVPARTPADVVDRLSRGVQAVLARPDVKQRLLQLHLVADGSSPEQLREQLSADVRRWAGVIERAGIPRQ